MARQAGGIAKTCAGRVTRLGYRLPIRQPVSREGGPFGIARQLTQLEDACDSGEGRLRKWAHMLGYGGHCLTKSRRYSVTFGQLRTARRDHRRAQRHPEVERDPWGRPLDNTVVLIPGRWQCTGTGHATQAEADLAMAAAARAREHEPWPAQAA